MELNFIHLNHICNASADVIPIDTVQENLLPFTQVPQHVLRKKHKLKY